MTYRLAAIVLLILSINAAADDTDTSYADEDWFPVDDQHYMAVAATTDADMVLHMRTLSLDPSSPAETVIALRHDKRCQHSSEVDTSLWQADGTLELNQKTLAAESRCEGHSRLYRPHSAEDTDYLYDLITSDRPITVRIGEAHGQFDNVNGKEALDDLHTLPGTDTPNNTRPHDDVLPTDREPSATLPSSASANTATHEH
ncbi:hypothetical protein [Zymobacter palmae]|uniref:NADH:ubiquinone oxidoreductase 27 kD subunit n=1 Tax=Zymobacter palmae TaxID=33074 RepID=A0A348HDN4_9GAMM|nr:hypothetical protein [Zymobacter palmae]BBG29736.1 NADH:ubiquinone oxidoreductase 27 kD subunit [Zymobacter palmae]